MNRTNRLLTFIAVMLVIITVNVLVFDVVLVYLITAGVEALKNQGQLGPG